MTNCRIRISNRPLFTKGRNIEFVFSESSGKMTKSIYGFKKFLYQFNLISALYIMTIYDIMAIYPTLMIGTLLE